MRSIVVPVNFSANSANAARYAADLALTIGADVNLIYVFQIPTSVAEVPMPESVFDEMRDSGLELLEDLKTTLCKRTDGKLKVTTNMKIGGIEPNIEAFCKEQKPFLVVMGASGHLLENVINGSTTVSAIRHLPYLVLVIPENAIFKGVKRIVMASDREDIFGGMSDNMIFLKELSDLMKAELLVLHVLTNGEESAAEVVEEYNIWKKDLMAFRPEMHFVRQSKVDEGINDYLSSHQGDWLMVFPKNHSALEFHRSRAKQIVETCAVPVMSLHE